MAWTNGFFNSLNGDRKYNAQQLSRIFEGLITDGVYESVGNKLAVQPNSGMTVQINTGRGWFFGHWVNNDSEYLFVLENADVLLKRYCAVCIRVDENIEYRSAVPYLKYSEFATDPVKPEMERTETVREYCLAYILIPAGATEITAADIEDTRGYTDLCGWVTGLIEQVDTHTLYTQWQALWDKFMADKEAQAESYMTSQSEELEAWKVEQQTDFLAWYENLQTNLEGDVAVTLTSKVTILETDVHNLKEDVADLKEKQAIKATGVIDGLGWQSDGEGIYTQIVTIEGVTADNSVFVCPSDDFKEIYETMECKCIAQGENSLTFECYNPQDVNVTVEIIIFNI